MNATWIMVLIITGAGGGTGYGTSVAIEKFSFPDSDSCRAAASLFDGQNIDRNHLATAVCFPAGGAS